MGRHSYESIDGEPRSWKAAGAAVFAVGSLVVALSTAPGQRMGRSAAMSLYTAGQKLDASTAAELDAKCTSETADFHSVETLAGPPTASPTTPQLFDVFWTDGTYGEVDESYVWTTNNFDEGIIATVLVDTLGFAKGIDVASNGTTVYFTANGCVAKVDTDGYNLEALVCYEDSVIDSSNMQGLAIWEGADKIYWVDADLNALYTTGLEDNDGTFSELASTFEYPMDVAVDKTAGKLYISDARGIHKMDSDGSDASIVLTQGDGFQKFRGIDIDSFSRNLYFMAMSDWTTGVMYATNVNDPKQYWELYSGLNEPVGVAVDSTQGLVFWTEGKGVYRGTTSGSTGEDAIKIAMIEDARFVAVVSEVTPTPAPTSLPTSSPTKAPIPAPTFSPTLIPTSEPTPKPSEVPTSAPTKYPTAFPTSAPVPVPTVAPTSAPIPAPSVTPSLLPTSSPSKFPTSFPTPVPVPEPTSHPTSTPTSAPTPWCQPRMVECGFCDGSAGYTCSSSTAL